MGYERFPRNTNSQNDYDGRRNLHYDNRDDGPNRSYGYAGGGYAGGRDDGDRGYGQRGGFYGDQGRGYGGRDQGRYGNADRERYGQQSQYHGSYASDGRRFEDVGRYAHADDDNYAHDSRTGRSRFYGGQPQGYDYDDRTLFQRAGDEVRSWFGDEEAERRRDLDQRYDEHDQGNPVLRHPDSDYHSWRSGQIAALDRDYDEYRREHRAKFENEFSNWRTARQGQRESLVQVKEHQDVVGSDGEHVGTVDKVRGDRILLTKNDAEAGGRHHSIPSNWVAGVDDKVTLNKTAAEAHQHWRDEERNQAFFGDRSEGDDRQRTTKRTGATTY